MHESSAWKIFRTKTGIQSQIDASDESTSVMTYLNILWVTEKLYNFRTVPGGEAGTELLEFSRLQPWTKYLRQTLVFLWNSALKESFNFYLWGVFC